LSIVYQTIGEMNKAHSAPLTKNVGMNLVSEYSNNSKEEIFRQHFNKLRHGRATGTAMGTDPVVAFEPMGTDPVAAFEPMGTDPFVQIFK
jgi:hypothetical protein